MELHVALLLISPLYLLYSKHGDTHSPLQREPHNFSSSDLLYELCWRFTPFYRTFGTPNIYYQTKDVSSIVLTNPDSLIMKLHGELRILWGNTGRSPTEDLHHSTLSSPTFFTQWSPRIQSDWMNTTHYCPNTDTLWPYMELHVMIILYLFLCFPPNYPGYGRDSRVTLLTFHSQQTITELPLLTEDIDFSSSIVWERWLRESLLRFWLFLLHWIIV